MATSLLFDRLIAVHRPLLSAATSATVGDVGYFGMTAVPAGSDTNQGETVLFTSIAASIEAAQTGRKRSSALPSDVVVAPTWIILCAPGALAKASVRDRDLIVDDENYRYEIAQAEWSMLGYRLICIRLEA